MREQTASDSVIINEVQLLLAEKRTSLATMRRGIAFFALPLSVLSILIATSKYYNVMQVMHLFVPLLASNAALALLGSHLIIQSMIRIRRYDRLILRLRRKHSQIAEFIE